MELKADMDPNPHYGIIYADPKHCKNALESTASQNDRPLVVKMLVTALPFVLTLF